MEFIVAFGQRQSQLTFPPATSYPFQCNPYLLSKQAGGILKVLVIGSGGREHALVWALKKSSRVSEVVCAPGNGGIAEIATCIPVDVKDLNEMLGVVGQVHPDLTVVGPELPLSLGLVDELQQRGLRVFGPTQAAARLESSKGFAKEFMQRHHIPTPHYAVCTSEKELRDALEFFSTPVVVKADGLAAGKGVVICESKDEAAQVALEMLSGKALGEAGIRVVLEEFLTGDEISFLVLCDGEHVAPLVASRDHKRIGDGDTGPNTGGMGAYSSDTLLDANMTEWLLAHIARPVVQGMAGEGSPYRGILYCGIMITARGPQVLEFNCRFGDPETQAVLMRLDSDIVDAFESAIDGRVSESEMRWSGDPAVCVVVAAGGYPGSYESGKQINGLADAATVEGVTVFHAGTTLKDGKIYTSGGRVLGVTARATDLETAVKRAYDAVGKISFDGMYVRKDIAARALAKK